MVHSFTGEYKRVRLIPLTEVDIEALRILRNEPYNRKWFVYSNEILEVEQEKWFKEYNVASDDFMFSVRHVDNPEKFIGAVAIYNVDFTNLTAEFGRIIIDSGAHEDRGLGLDTTVCALNIGFKMMNLREIYLEVYADNKRATKVYLKAGFKEISIDKNSNILYMKISKEEFQI